MRDELITIEFLPAQRTIRVTKGTRLDQVILQVGIDELGLNINAPCGGQGTCGQCRVQFKSGAPVASTVDERFFNQGQLDAGWRLACMCECCDSAEVFIPEEHDQDTEHKILTGAVHAIPETIQPAVQKRYIEMKPPTLEDTRGDLERLTDEMGSFNIGGGALRKLSAELRDNGFVGTAVLCEQAWIGFEAEDTTAACYGLAFDIGTTTVVGTLLDLNRGQVLAVLSRLNPQVRFGDDVLSRILHASEQADGLQNLTESIQRGVAEIIVELCQQAEVPPEQVYEVVFAGNTTMQQLLMGIDPSPLGQMPFVPVTTQAVRLAARDLGLPIHAEARVYLLPVMSGFVGGDIVAGMVSTDLAQVDGPVLLVDLGTNGEMVLANEGKFWAASTAAGPAFEGARIRCGMRAALGAVENAMFGEDLTVSIIGGGAARGICGSGLIDLVAGLIRVGIVDTTGRMLEPDQLSEMIPVALRERVVLNAQGHVEFEIAEDGQGRRVYLAAQDIREFQLAVGAVRAGIVVLLKQVGLEPADLKNVLIAGGMGNYLDGKHACQLGLIPNTVALDRIRYVGNTSLAGAQQVLLSTEVRQRAEEMAHTVNHVELSLNQDFQMEFAEAMIFPEP